MEAQVDQACCGRTGRGTSNCAKHHTSRAADQTDQRTANHADVGTMLRVHILRVVDLGCPVHVLDQDCSIQNGNTMRSL